MSDAPQQPGTPGTPDIHPLAARLNLDAAFTHPGAKPGVEPSFEHCHPGIMFVGKGMDTLAEHAASIMGVPPRSIYAASGNEAATALEYLYTLPTNQREIRVGAIALATSTLGAFTLVERVRRPEFTQHYAEVPFIAYGPEDHAARILSIKDGANTQFHPVAEMTPEAIGQIAAAIARTYDQLYARL